MKVRANHIEVHYEQSGREGAPVVVLSHSLGSSLLMWTPQMEALQTHYQVLRYDTRGHGATEAPAGPYTLEMLAEDAVGLLDALHLDRVHFVGLSMGGMIGLCLALDHAHRLRSLSLCDTSAMLPQEAQPVWQERIQTARREGMRALVDSTLERWFTPDYRALNPPEVKTIRQQFLGTPVDGYIGCSEAIRGLNYLERLSEITMPTLIMVGEMDPGTPVAASKLMHERIAGSRLVVIPHAAHLSNVEQPETFNRALLNFLQDL